MDDALKQMRDNLYKQIEERLLSGGSVDASTMSIYVQLKILDILDSIDSRLISVEDAIVNLNPTYK
jgi:hypothetical protein